MTVDDLLAVAFPFLIRLQVPFRGVRERTGVIFIGPSGWGEFAPFDDYDDVAASRWLDCAVEAAFGEWPIPRIEQVTVNAIIPAIAIGDALSLVDAALDRGHQVFKLKVGDDPVEDVRRVNAICTHIAQTAPGDQWRIRLDANGAWEPNQAIEVLDHLRDCPIEYVEQPCLEPSALQQIRATTGVPIAVDELIRRNPDPFTALDLIRQCADVIILKAAPLGGVQRCMALARAIDLPVVVSGSLDSSVGLGPGLALAAALPVDRACGLGTSSLLATDLTEPPLIANFGRLPTTRPVGSLDRLHQAAGALSEQRRRQLLDRVRRAWQGGTAARWEQLVTPPRAS